MGLEAGEFLVMAIIGAIFNAIVNGLTQAFEWLGAEWHWLQILAPVAVIGGLTWTFRKQLQTVRTGFKVLWCIPGVGVPFIFLIWCGNVDEAQVVSAFAQFQTWQVVSVLSLLIFPMIGFLEPETHEKEDLRLQEEFARNQRYRRERKPFGSAGKASDEKLKRAGMI